MKFDKEQEIAAKYIKNHSLIIAGAGSGKTTTLLLKIQYLVNRGIKENEILVISFTNETVNHFKNKCKYNINVLTFHKLACQIINNRKEIVDDDLLENIIISYLSAIPTKLKRKLYNIFCSKKYSEENYDNEIQKFYSDSLPNYLSSVIKQIKANLIDIYRINTKKLNKNESIFLYCCANILKYYNQYLIDNKLTDFDNMIIDATTLINNNQYKNQYKYILVDEYQDISKIRLNFLISLINSNKSTLTAVGDDFQSIYGFSGSNINLFYDFKQYFKEAKIFYIHTSYRCPQIIIKKAGKFIMKNPCQMRKNIISNSNVAGKIIKIRTTKPEKKLIQIINNYKNKSILILGRNHFDINPFLKNDLKIENSYIIYKNIKYKNVRFLTMHKSKGLESDIVIIINLTSSNHGFPIKENNSIIKKILNNNESFKYAEERRLFYVALTRSKSKVFLLIDRLNPSQFINEI